MFGEDSSLHTAASCGINKAIKLIVTHSSPYAGPFSNCLTMFFYQLTAFLWEIVFTADFRWMGVIIIKLSYISRSVKQIYRAALGSRQNRKKFEICVLGWRGQTPKCEKFHTLFSILKASLNWIGWKRNNFSIELNKCWLIGGDLQCSQWVVNFWQSLWSNRRETCRQADLSTCLKYWFLILSRRRESPDTRDVRVITPTITRQLFYSLTEIKMAKLSSFSLWSLWE